MKNILAKLKQNIKEIVEMNPKDLIPYDNNARIHNVDAIADSIRDFGFKEIVLVDENNVIINGHGRVKASIKLGLEKIPVCICTDLTEEEKKAYRLLDNKVAELTEWDEEKLKSELQSIEDIDMSAFGGAIEELEKQQKQIVEDEVPTDNIPKRAKRGQIWKLGEHRLMCGDSTSKQDVEKLMNGNIADIEITSPPYNVGKSSILSGNSCMTKSKYIESDDNLIDYDALLNKTTENGIYFSKYAFVNLQMLANNKVQLIEYLNLFKKNLCDIVIWNKGFGAPAMAERVMNSAFEFIFVFSKISNTRAIGTKNFRGVVPNIFDCNQQRNNEFASIHSATFPIAFPSHFINNFTNEKDSILDLFGGTGTTMIACEQLNRKCFMMELCEHYCDVILQRWENLTGKKAEVIEE